MSWAHRLNEWLGQRYGAWRQFRGWLLSAGWLPWNRGHA